MLLLPKPCSSKWLNVTVQHATPIVITAVQQEVDYVTLGCVTLGTD